MRTWAIWIIAAIMVSAVGCGNRRIKRTPDELIGVWKTSAERYADRFMEFKLEQVVFGTGGLTSVTCPLRGLKRKIKADCTDYTVYYESEDGLEYSMALWFFPQDGGIIRFKNQQDVTWKRETR